MKQQVSDAAKAVVVRISNFLLAFGWSRIEWLAALMAMVSANFFWLLYADTGYLNDWYYFSSLSLVVRSLVLEYGLFPLHNPWVCGGLDILSNPQNRIFSPNFLFDLLLPVPSGNLASLMLFGLLGFVGCVRWLRQFGVDSKNAVLGGVLWVHASWFGLHYAEGHIPFGGMQMLPWVAYFLMRIDRPQAVLGLASLIAWLILDGAIYAVIFSFFVGLSLLATGQIPLGGLIQLIRVRLVMMVSIMLGAVLLALPKLLPVLLAIGDRQPVLDDFTMSWSLIGEALFDPFVDLTKAAKRPDGSDFWRMHEFGNYLSWIGLFLLAVRAWESFKISRFGWGLIAVMGFWIWVGTGLLPNANPWRVFQSLPLVNNAHVQSRTFLIMHMFFILALAWTLMKLRLPAKTWALVAVMMLFEAFIVRNHPMFERPPYYEPLPGYTRIKKNRTVDETVVGLRWMPSHYMQAANEGAKSCYEPSFQTALVRAREDADYRGEIYVVPPASGRVDLQEYTPGRIRLTYELEKRGRIELNTNALWGWQAVAGNHRVIGRGRDLLSVEPDGLVGEVELIYRPPWLSWIFASYFAGLILLAFCWYRIAASSQKSR